MSKRSYDKGRRGETEWAAFCRERGFNVWRQGQERYQRGSDRADVEGLDAVHMEVKRQETTCLSKWMRQAATDAADEGRGRLPVVAHRRNREPWLVTMRAEDWLSLLGAVLHGERSPQKWGDVL